MDANPPKSKSLQIHRKQLCSLTDCKAALLAILVNLNLEHLYVSELNHVMNMSEQLHMSDMWGSLRIGHSLFPLFKKGIRHSPNHSVLNLKERGLSNWCATVELRAGHHPRLLSRHSILNVMVKNLIMAKYLLADVVEELQSTGNVGHESLAPICFNVS